MCLKVKIVQTQLKSAWLSLTQIDLAQLNFTQLDSARFSLTQLDSAWVQNDNKNVEM